MTEIDYEYECSRAELLGLPKPSKEEFFARERKTTGVENEEEEEIIAEQAEEASVKQEGFRRIGGGLDELNSILSTTQKKLNRFKMVCGSFSNILKFHPDAKKEDDDGKQVEVVHVNDMISGDENCEDVKKKTVVGSPLVQNKKGGDSQLDKLDSLINKAERAELSLSSQNKQMKKFLN